MLSYLFPLIIVTLAQATPQVQLGETTITGTTVSTNVEAFKGIPFASSPVGELRFQPPVLQTSLNVSAFNASTYGPACLQPANPQLQYGISEDCLTLDVYRPAGVSGPLPVFVWIYGGGFELGTSSRYNLTLFVNKSVERGTPIIAIVLNYRLLQLGFPQGEEAASRNALNLGLKDQLVGLEWVQANIEAFGGDKEQVTLGGESAGAYSVYIHLQGSTLKSLARAAITGSIFTQPIYKPTDQASKDSWNDFVSAIPECASTVGSPDTFTCLQQVNASSLLNAIGAGASFQPVIDGLEGLIPDYHSQVPLLSPLPLLIGSNLDEGTVFAPQNLNSSDEIRSILINQSTPSPRGAEALEEAVNTVFDLYPNDPALGSPYGTGNETFGFKAEYKRLSAIMGDFLFQSRIRALAIDSSQNYKQPTYAYHFTDANAFLPNGFFPGYDVSAIGVAHVSELFFLNFFGPLSAFNVTDPESLALSGKMQDYWLSFITSVDPNDGKGSERPEWIEYTSQGTPQLLRLDGQNLALSPPFREEQVDFWNQDPLVFRK